MNESKAPKIEQERELYANTLKSNVTDEMTAASDTSHANISVHKNPLSETTQYLFKNDVYDIFKVNLKDNFLDINLKLNCIYYYIC